MNWHFTVVPPSPGVGRSLLCQVAGWRGAHPLLRGRQATGHHFLSVSASFIHSFAGRKLWEARFLKTVNLQSGLARSAGKDRGFLQLVRVDGGALVNRSPQESLSTGSGVRQLCFDKAGVMYSQATVISPEVKRWGRERRAFKQREKLKRFAPRNLKDSLQWSGTWLTPVEPDYQRMGQL